MDEKSREDFDDGTYRIGNFNKDGLKEGKWFYYNEFRFSIC
jgi:hypothetical protein